MLLCLSPNGTLGIQEWLGALGGAVGVFMTVGAAILCRRQVVSALARAREERLLREAEEAAAGTELTVPSHRSDV